MAELVTLDLFEKALRNAHADGAAFMLIGGLAVGYWAKRYDVFDWPGETIYMIGKIHAFNSRRPGQSDNDAKHLELLRRLLPAFMQEACERGLVEDIRERASALLEILETWKVPFEPESLAALKAELRQRAA